MWHRQSTGPQPFHINLQIDLCRFRSLMAKNRTNHRERNISFQQVCRFMSENKICQILNVEKPVIQGPMAWSSFAPLVAAVSKTLLPQIVRKLSIPVVASGGIADGYGMAAAIALGADGFEMGSRFLCATENTIHENAKQAIIQAGAMQSVITSTSTFDPCRQLQNAYTDKMIDLERNYPISEVADQMRTLAKPALKTAMHDGDIENGGVMVGMIAPLINDIKPAGEIIDSCLAECRQVIESMTHFVF